MLLRAWPEIRRRTGAPLRIVGADPLAVRLLLARDRVPDDGIDILGFLSQDDLTAELLRRRRSSRPRSAARASAWSSRARSRARRRSLRLTSTGTRPSMTPETGVMVPPGEPAALADAVIELLADEPRRQELGAAARRIAEERYSWDAIAQRLLEIYERVTGGPGRGRGGAVSRRLAQSRLLRIGVVLPVAGGVAALLWFRGPDWHVVGGRVPGGALGVGGRGGRAQPALGRRRARSRGAR